MKFGGAVLFVDDVPTVLGFYERVFEVQRNFYDAELGFAELTVGGASLAIASHQSGNFMMPNAYKRSETGGPSGGCITEKIHVSALLWDCLLGQGRNIAVMRHGEDPRADLRRLRPYRQPEPLQREAQPLPHLASAK